MQAFQGIWPDVDSDLYFLIRHIYTRHIDYVIRRRVALKIIETVDKSFVEVEDYDLFMSKFLKRFFRLKVSGQRNSR